MSSYCDTILYGDVPTWLMPESHFTPPDDFAANLSVVVVPEDDAHRRQAAATPHPGTFYDLAVALKQSSNLSAGDEKALGIDRVKEALVLLENPQSGAGLGFRDGIKFAVNDVSVKASTMDIWSRLAQVIGQRCAQCVADQFLCLARRLRNQTASGRGRLVCFSNSFSGGGIAEMYRSLCVSLAGVGVDVEWHGMTFFSCDPTFLEGPRKVFDALQGRTSCVLSEVEIRVWESVAALIARVFASVCYDPRVAALVFEDHHAAFLIPYFAATRKKAVAAGQPPQRFIWRLHFDTEGLKRGSSDAQAAWGLLSRKLESLDGAFGDTVLFQPWSLPSSLPASASTPLHVFKMPPGVDLLAPKNFPLASNDVLNKLLGEIDAAQGTIHQELRAKNMPVLDVAGAPPPWTAGDAHWLVTGGRLVPWKGIFATVSAFATCAADHPKVNLAVAIAVSLDDPRKVTGYATLIQLIKQLRMQQRIRVVVNESSRLNALYTLAGRSSLPVVLCSYAEGWNLMADEAALHGAVPLTSDCGGLQRFAMLPFVRKHTVPWASVSGGGDPSGYFILLASDDDAADGDGGRRVIESAESQVFTSMLALELRAMLDERSNNPDAYSAWYASAASIAARAAGNTSLVKMALQYLALAVGGPSEMAAAAGGGASDLQNLPMAHMATVCCMHSQLPNPKPCGDLPDAILAFDAAMAMMDGRPPMALLDFDGTLVDLAARPDLVAVEPNLVSFLRNLRFPVAIVTGRAIADILSFFPLLPGQKENLVFAGCHGYDIKLPNGAVQHIEAELRLDFAKMHAFVMSQKAALRFPGECVIEFKGASIALHYRQAPHAVDDLLAVAREAVVANAKDLSRFRVIHFSLPHEMVIEIASASSWNKGMCISSLMQHDVSGSFCPIFIGDSTTDESGFQVLPHGVTVRVQHVDATDALTSAKFKLESPAAVRRFLSLLERFVDDASRPIVAET